MKYSFVSKLFEFVCIDFNGVEIDVYDEFDVDDDGFYSSSVVPLSPHFIKLDCANNIVRSTLSFDLQVQVQAMESFSLSPQILTVQQSPNILELKPLPNSLKYVYLEDEERLPVIIFTSFIVKQDQRLLQVHKKHKKAIRWTLANIPAISPSTCMHEILLEDKAKPVRNHKGDSTLHP